MKIKQTSIFQMRVSFFRKASEAKSPRGSLVEGFAFGALAASFFWQGEYRDPEQGREFYQKAVDVFGARGDPYSQTLKASTLRSLAQNEAHIECLDQAIQRLDEAERVARAIPDWYAAREIEYRAISTLWSFLASMLFKRGQASEGRMLFGRALQPFSDVFVNDLILDTRSQILMRWAWSESLAGNRPDALQKVAEAEGFLARLSEAYALKSRQLHLFKQAKQELVDKAEGMDVDDRRPFPYSDQMSPPPMTFVEAEHEVTRKVAEHRNRH